MPYVEPEDIANVAVVLASDESRYVTGQQIRVDSGGGAPQVRRRASRLAASSPALKSFAQLLRWARSLRVAARSITQHIGTARQASAIAGPSDPQVPSGKSQWLRLSRITESDTDGAAGASFRATGRRRKPSV